MGRRCWPRRVGAGWRAWSRSGSAAPTGPAAAATIGSRWTPEMSLPLKPPIKPQLALTRKQLPEGEEWAYEPKLDGFRAITFVDGAEVYIQSRGAKSLRRYFPELSFAPGRYVIDGELVIRNEAGELEFDALQSRLHPAESRVQFLAKEIPAGYVVFDLLAEGDEILLERPLAERRERLEALAKQTGAIELTPADRRRRAGRGMAALDRRSDRQAARRALPPGPASRDGEGEARADDRLRRDGLAAGQGGGNGRLPDPRALRRRRAASRRPHLRLHARRPSAPCGNSWRRWRPAPRDRASRAAGPAAATWIGWSCDRSW